MINKIFSNQIFKIIQRRNFQYSKIDRFIEQLSKDEFYFSPKNQTGNGIIFTNLMKNLNEMKSYGFNYQLTEYLQQYPITSEQIVILLQNLQSNSMHCSNANKSLLLQAMKKELTYLNDKITIILQHGFSLGINDSEILNQYLQYFEVAKLENFSYNQLFDILFVIAQAATNQKVSFKLNEFSEKWSLLINLLTNSLETKETFYVKKYPHFAFIMKGICKMQDDQNQKQMLVDLENLFLQTTKKFTENKQLNFLDSKEYTILFSSINFLKLHIQSEIIENLVEEMIQHLLSSDFQQFNDLSLQSLALTFTFIPQHQIQLQAKLFQQMTKNQEKQKYNIKAYLSILFEIIFKWKNSFFDKHELYLILNDMKVIEQSDYDIAQYFQILTTLNNNQILEILKNKERELKYRKEKNAKLDYYKPDQISIMRLKKSLHKIEGRIRDYKPTEQESQLLKRILTLFS